MGRKTARDFWINRMTVLDPRDRRKGEGEREELRKRGRQREREIRGPKTRMTKHPGGCTIWILRGRD